MPRPPIPNFFDALLAANRPQLAEFRHWLCHPGMLFQSRQQWWGREKPRPTPHEGLDLCWFQDSAGRRRSLDHLTVIPAPFSGQVVQIIDDFLGQSIFLVHSAREADGRRLLFALGHTTPRTGLTPGDLIQPGDILARLANPTPAKSRVPPHLHLTLTLMPDTLASTRLGWDYLGTAPEITLLDPLAIFPTAVALI